MYLALGIAVVANGVNHFFLPFKTKSIALSYLFYDDVVSISAA